MVETWWTPSKRGFSDGNRTRSEDPEPVVTASPSTLNSPL